MPRYALILVLVMPALLAGCQSATTSTGRGVATPGRSIVFNAPAQRGADAVRPEAALPWYIARRDARFAVSLGVEPAVYERSVTVTRDRQRTFRGRVYDSYSQTTYRTQVRDLVR
ncbi:MAG: hypothetical protein WD009_04075 [Phycisphaeraceae bacterium]